MTRRTPTYTGPATFMAANHYGLTAKNGSGEPLSEGSQLNNNGRDKFIIRKLARNIVTIESMAAPGLYIGLGQRSDEYNHPVYEAVLVRASTESENHKLRMVAAKNNRTAFVSFEPVSQPGFVLNHCCGWQYFSNRPNWPNEHVFRQDASWKIEPALTLEERLQRCPTIHYSDLLSGAVGVDECPCCMESWTNKTQVLTECGHTFCSQCIASICEISPPAHKGTCAMCRASVSLSELRRVTYPATSPSDDQINTEGQSASEIGSN